MIIYNGEIKMRWLIWWEIKRDKKLKIYFNKVNIQLMKMYY